MPYGKFNLNIAHRPAGNVDISSRQHSKHKYYHHRCTSLDIPSSQNRLLSLEPDYPTKKTATAASYYYTDTAFAPDQPTVFRVASGTSLHPPHSCSHSPTPSFTSHIDLLRTDSGNSSLNTIDSASNSSSSSPGSCLNSTACHPNPSEDLCCGVDEEEEDYLLVNVYVPETQCEYDITCCQKQTIWCVKSVLIEKSQGNLRENGFNHGLFCFAYEHFLDEELTFFDYFAQLLQENNSCSVNNRKTRPFIRLEFLYKQRVKYGEVMSTLPLASTTRKKRKRSRLLSAIQNANLDKVTKALVNCDPNFVDEATGETPLSLAAASQPSTSASLQQILVAIVNGGALLDFRTKDGRTALHVAVQKSNFIALKTLLDLGASPNYIDVNGLTPLYYSVIYKSNPKLTQLLLHEHATHGITDQHGWQEVHQASKLGLVAHLEQLLFYGCDMNCRIVGSGNTPLHVAAINDQVECVRILLLRGCDTSIVNNSHQNAYQVAVIAANMSLADLIKNHKPENVVPYRDKPRFNPARRPQNHYTDRTCKAQSGLNGNDSAGHLSVRPTSPSLSQTTNNTTTTSSGVCCEDEIETTRQQQMSKMNNGNEEDDDELDDEDEDIEEEDDVATSESEDNSTLSPGMTVKAVADYNSGDPSHLQLRRNDQVLLLHSDHSPPTIAFQKLLLGRRCTDGQEGFFPACCVEKIKLNKHRHSNGDTSEQCERVEGRRDMKFKNVMSATLPSRGRRGARKCLLDKGVTRQYQERVVTLHRGNKGFGFVLRGAKDSSPILTKQLMQHGSSVPLIGLQYFDEIETGGVADAAGLKRGDFLLAVNDVDVRHMSHENVVQLIRQSGDKVTMTIATPVPKQLVSILKKKGRSNRQPTGNEADKITNGAGTSDGISSSQSQTQMSQSVYASFNNKSNKAPPPAPPKRDPSTTLSTSRARARSLVVPSEVRSAHNHTMMMMNEAKTAVDDIDKKDAEDEVKCSSPSSVESITNRQNQISGGVNVNRVASIHSRSSRRISSYELNDFISRQSDDSKQHKINSTDQKDSNGESNTKDLNCQVNTQETQVKLLDSHKNSTLSPPGSPRQNSIQTSIVKVTLSKLQASEHSNFDVNKTSDTATRSLSSFQPNCSSNQEVKPEGSSEEAPQIPEPDYSSDEEEKQGKKKLDVSQSDRKQNGEEKDTSKALIDAPSHGTHKLTTTATVILKSSSPCPPDGLPTESNTTEPVKSKMFASKNMFEELREQSAKITSSARLRFASNRQNSQERTLTRANSQDESQPVNNVMKNVAEFEKRLSISGSKEQTPSRTSNEPCSISEQTNANASSQLRMSKSCIEEFVPNNVPLKKDFSTLTKVHTKHHSGQQDCRRNSAIISAIAEKVAAVNQLVAEQQQSVPSGSKSLNSSPIPTSLVKLPNQSGMVVVQKPIAVLPSNTAVNSATLTRRCVTLCEDPVKTIHLQQQHQQLRSQLAAQIASGQQSRPKHSSLAESTSSILKQSTKALRNTTMSYSPNSEGSIDLVPPPPEFAAPGAQQPSGASVSCQAIPPNLRQTMTAQQKAYLQRQLQSSTSPLTIQTGTSAAHHHHHHHQLMAESSAPLQSHYNQQTQLYHTHHHHNHHQQQHQQQGHTTGSVALSSSAPTNSDALTLMRASMLANSSQQVQSVSNYDFVTSQAANQSKPAQLQVSTHHPQSNQQQIYSQQSSQQQQQQQSAQNQLLLQQRALAVANAKLLQQQHAQTMRPQSSTGHYNTLATSKPQQIQYYVSHQPNQQQHPQYFATLSRHQHAQAQQQYLNSLSSQQQQMQQQQFATLTRHHQQQLQQHLQPALQQGINYTQLLQQRQQQQPQHQQQQQLSSSVPISANARLVQLQATNRQTPPTAGAKMSHTYASSGITHQQQYQQQQQQTCNSQQTIVAPYARKSVVEWTPNDVQEWLQRIGMAEHRPKFECFNGAKMLRLDNNSLANVGVRQQQHRIYILEKLKQQIWQSHQ